MKMQQRTKKKKTFLTQYDELKGKKHAIATFYLYIASKLSTSKYTCYNCLLTAVTVKIVKSLEEKKLCFFPLAK